MEQKCIGIFHCVHFNFNLQHETSWGDGFENNIDDTRFEIFFLEKRSFLNAFTRQQISFIFLRQKESELESHFDAQNPMKSPISRPIAEVFQYNCFQDMTKSQYAIKLNRRKILTKNISIFYCIKVDLYAPLCSKSTVLRFYSLISLGNVVIFGLQIHFNIYEDLKRAFNEI